MSNLPVGLLVFLAVPLLVTDNRHGPLTQAVNIAGSVAAGVMEEIVFRGLIQRLLYRHIRPALAILGATALFVAYHIGVVPFHWYAYAQIVPASLVLGTLYAGTGSLPLAMAVHALFDLLAEFGPVFAVPISFTAAFALLCLAAVLTLAWGWQTLRAGSLAELEARED
jgi:membrane protease YdiL (CAAX protease family)